MRSLTSVRPKSYWEAVLAAFKMRWPVIDPGTSIALERWDRSMCAILALITFTVPFETAFMKLEMHPSFVFTFVADMMHVFDIVCGVSQQSRIPDVQGPA